MTTKSTLPVITDEMCRAAIQAGKTDRIQGFSYGPDFTAPHVLRDVTRHPEEQVLWSGASHDEMMERHAIERMRLQLAAALAAQPAEALACPTKMLITAAETLLQAPDLTDVDDADKDPETVDAERQLRTAIAVARKDG